MQEKSSYTIEELVVLFKNNHRLALAGIMAYYRPIIKKLVRFYLRDDQEAEEVLSHCILKVHERKDHFVGLADKDAWVKRVAINKARNMHRNNSRQSFIDLPSAELIKDENELHSQLDAAELKKRIEQALLSLNGQERKVAELSIKHGLDPKQIARYLKRTQSTIRTQLSKALEKIKKRTLDNFILI